MSTLRETVKQMLPQRMRNGLRYITDTRYRDAMRATRAGEQQRARVDALVKESADALWTATGGKVASGPFAGMRYVRESVGSQWAPKLLGTYEMELSPVIEEIVRRAPSRIVDIGAAEGYYAVGLAQRIPASSVVAFEAEESRHALLRELASSNEVLDRVQIKGRCTAASLSESLDETARTLVVCDIEGAELDLIDPATAPGLRHADVLVEIHPWGHEQMSEAIWQRFQETHAIREIDARPRALVDLPSAAHALSESAALACMDETRPCPMSWLWMTAT